MVMKNAASFRPLDQCHSLGIDVSKSSLDVVALAESGAWKRTNRLQLDIGYRIDNISIEFFGIRPYRRDESQILEHAVAKATCVKSENIWKLYLYWQQVNLKWHIYEPVAETKTVEEFFDAVVADPHGCFWG